MIKGTTYVSVERAAEINNVQAREVSFKVARHQIDFKNCIKRKIG